jgi:hypothetical protein
MPPAHRTFQMPVATWKHVVLIHQVAAALGWTTARVRSVDEILRPQRLADGSRAYDLERVRFFVYTTCAFDSRRH